MAPIRYSLLISGTLSLVVLAQGAGSPAAEDFRRKVQPILSQYCYDCHGDGMKKGGVAFDELTTDEQILSHDLWLKALKNVRAGLMPPLKKGRPNPDEQKTLETWIKFEAFGIDSKNPDPGRVTVRRLNRVEYRNTIRDLFGVEFDTESEFPPDDTGYGFDNIGDVLTISPMLLEKYLAAARTIVSEAVPTVPRTMPEHVINGDEFTNGEKGAHNRKDSRLTLSYHEHAAVSNVFRAEHDGRYQLVVALSANEKHVENRFDYNKCQLLFKADGKELIRQEFVREGGKPFHFEFDQDWKAGAHELNFELIPLTPEATQVRSLTLRIESVKVRGPFDEKYWVRPKNYERYFTHEAPAAPEQRRAYATELLRGLATKAFRRPPDHRTVERLVALAEDVYSQSGKAFEEGVAHAMVGIIASPRFLFREEASASPRTGRSFPLIDEYSLASRLSYFLWSSMPDDELLGLAGKGELRKQLGSQVQRMLRDERARAFVQNFTGQWLQGRDIDTVVIDARTVLAREEKVDREAERRRARFRELRLKRDEDLTPEEKEEMAKMRLEFVRRAALPRPELTGELRQAMRREMELYFGSIVREDRSVVELLESDYTFLNERLAKHYSLTNLNVSGDELRRVTLPAESPRGGVLTMGSVLAVTSNPTRTSPVKRGLFVLDNILGIPPPPPPPDIPPLEDAAKDVKGREPSLRETLELHRSKPLCSSCHNRLDPLGLAFENFNAMGMWREKERDMPIDAAGKLLTGETFTNVAELKHILATNHRREFFRCLAEKLLTYAIGRGLEYYDVETVDEIVARLEKEDGRFSAVLMGVIESSPFQKCRGSAMVSEEKPAGGTRPSAQVSKKS
jgi:hypothetical protein